MRERLDAHRPPCAHFGKFSGHGARKGKAVSLKSAEQRIDIGSMHAAVLKQAFASPGIRAAISMPFLKEEAEA
jgi:hypothetical protein